MKITRINTQGLYRFLKFNNYVITYMLEYSLDGKHWKTYTEEEADGSQVRVRAYNILVIVGIIIFFRAYLMKSTCNKSCGVEFSPFFQK